MSLLRLQRMVLSSVSDMIDTRLTRNSYRPRWATVAAVDPIKIQYDGATVPSTITPSTLVAVRVGDRVQVGWHKGQATILGRAGGGGQPFAMDADWVTTAAPSGGGIGSTPVLFTPGRFTAPPIITVSVSSSSPAFRSVRATDRTATGFNVQLERTNDTQTTVYWQAIQMTPEG